MHSFWFGFLVPFLIALMFPLAVELCLPRSTRPARWIQNCPPFSVFMLAPFPIAMGIFTATIVSLNAVNDINVFAVKTFGSAWALYASVAVLIFMLALASKAVLHDFISRPVGPYVLRGRRAIEAFAIEKELRDAAKPTILQKRRERTRRRKKGSKAPKPNSSIGNHSGDEYRKLVHLTSLGEIVRHGNLVAAAYLAVAWVGTLSCVFYFWYVAVLVLSNQSLPAGAASKLMMIFILLITWFPMRVYMDWYQNYFHNTNWLNDSHGLKMGFVLAIFSLIFVMIISKPEAIYVVCAVVQASVLLFVGVAGKFKPDWLRAIAESLQSLPFFYFIGIYVVFLYVTLAVGIKILRI